MVVANEHGLEHEAALRREAHAPLVADGAKTLEAPAPGIAVHGATGLLPSARRTADKVAGRQECRFRL